MIYPTPKVLLISLQSNTDTIGLKAILAQVRAAGFDASILFVPSFCAADLPGIDRFVRRFAPDVVGISVMSTFVQNAAALSRFVKATFPLVDVVWGGIHPTCAPESSLSHADFVFVGESERAFVEFLRARAQNRPVEGIANIGFRRDGQVVVNPLRPLCQNIDELAVVDHLPPRSYVVDNHRVRAMERRLFRRHARFSGRFYSLTTMRGCPYNCSYCCNSVYHKLYGGGRVRKRSVKSVIAELVRAKQHNPELLMVKSVDECFFSHSTSWLRRFASQYKQKVGLRFLCHSVPAHVTDEKLALLKDAGLAWVLMGLQSGSKRVNRGVYHRAVSPQAFVEATRKINRHNVAGYYDVILDNPYENDDDLVATIDVLSRVPRPFLLQLYSLSFLPGTDLYIRARDDGLSVEDAETKNYHRVERTFLNKIVRLTPLYPRRVINNLVRRRNDPLGRATMRLLFVPSLVAVEPLVWLKVIYISQNNDPAAAAKMIAAFVKTGAVKVLLKKPV